MTKLNSGQLLFTSQQHVDKKAFEFVSGEGLLYVGEQALKPVNTILRGLAAVAIFVVGGLLLTFALMAAGAGPEWGFIVGFVVTGLGCIYVLLKKPGHREIFLRTADGQKYLTLSPTENFGFSDSSFDGFDALGNLVVKLRPGSWSLLRSRPLLCIDPANDLIIVSIANPDDVLKNSLYQSTMMDQFGQKIAEMQWISNIALVGGTRKFHIDFFKNNSSIPDCAILAVMLYFDAVLVRNYNYIETVSV